MKRRKPTATVFVYGTLKRGHGNHAWFLGESKFLGTGRTAESYAMHVAYGFPTVVASPPLYPVEGELYAVSLATLAELDRLEGHPSFYTRRLAGVTHEDGSEVEAWMYFGRPAGTRWLARGFWLELTPRDKRIA